MITIKHISFSEQLKVCVATFSLHIALIVALFACRSGQLTLTLWCIAFTLVALFSTAQAVQCVCRSQRRLCQEVFIGVQRVIKVDVDASLDRVSQNEAVICFDDHERHHTMVTSPS